MKAAPTKKPKSLKPAPRPTPFYTPAGRKRIAAAQRRRWAAFREAKAAKAQKLAARAAARRKAK